MLENNGLVFHRTCDASGDGELELEELENMLARITADGGNAHGVKCGCKVCVDWAAHNAVTTKVDWDTFKDKAAALDEDRSGSLNFCEFVCLAEGRKLNESELQDVAALEKVLLESEGVMHDPSALADCRCK